MTDAFIPILPKAYHLQCDGSNLLEWKIRMRAILVGMKLFGYIDGTGHPYAGRFGDGEFKGQGFYIGPDMAKAVLIANMEGFDVFLRGGYDEATMATLTAAQLWKAVDGGGTSAPSRRWDATVYQRAQPLRSHDEEVCVCGKRARLTDSNYTRYYGIRSKQNTFCQCPKRMHPSHSR